MAMELLPCCSSIASPSPLLFPPHGVFSFTAAAIISSKLPCHGLERGAFRGAVLHPNMLQPRHASRFAKFRRLEASNKALQQSSSDEYCTADGIALSIDESVAEERVLPQSLEDAVLQSTESLSAYVSAGGRRAVVELLFPELENLNEEGAQQRLWDLARLFLEELEARLTLKQLKAIFPDAGSAALLKYQWSDSTLKFASLNDRMPVSKDDELVVLVVPDYQMLANVERIASFLAEDDENSPRPLILWNPHLSSGDVGIGLNVRRMRENFLSTFTSVYSLRPVFAGAIFKSYPGIWQIFLEDKERPGRYLLAKEQMSRPNPDDIDNLLLGGGGNDVNEEPSSLAKAMRVFASFNRFMKALSK
ncbi:hypothetical protein O6H91_16G021600 [Diphasiastrum complanatum]|uniref:Uncharacterized protein n=1 Tax=Diphasiastrum complanatum TaxID=34168 RepID=A0ACC2BAC2_DIPCM|nr:hypothetical protein O6H91_16G021600 [Diphasiastrum complanatum]